VHNEHPATAFTADLYLSDASAISLTESVAIGHVAPSGQNNPDVGASCLSASRSWHAC
jgi:hypothetical protein